MIEYDEYYMVLTCIGNLFSFSKTTKTSVTLETETTASLRSVIIGAAGAISCN